MLADLVSAGLGAQGMSWETSPAATEVEEVMMEWLRQLVGLPAGFTGPRVFAIVKLDGLRVFSILVDAEPAKVAIGQRVRLSPLRVADDPGGNARWLPAFRPA